MDTRAEIRASVCFVLLLFPVNLWVSPVSFSLPIKNLLERLYEPCLHRNTQNSVASCALRRFSLGDIGRGMPQLRNGRCY
jgi:hypothetical protein